MESRDHITVYIDTDGLVTVEIPKGVMPDRNSIRAVAATINAERRRRYGGDQVGDSRRNRFAGDSVADDVGPLP